MGVIKSHPRKVSFDEKFRGNEKWLHEDILEGSSQFYKKV